VQIEEGAGVDAFLMGEPRLLLAGGYGSVAAEADGVTGSIFVISMLEVEAIRGEMEIRGSHWVACFQTLELPETLSTFYASATPPVMNRGASRSGSICSESGKVIWQFLG
jgi:hypothetical protein